MIHSWEWHTCVQRFLSELKKNAVDIYAKQTRISRLLRMILSELLNYFYITQAALDYFPRFDYSEATMNSTACIFCSQEVNGLIYLTLSTVQIILANT